MIIAVLLGLCCGLALLINHIFSTVDQNELKNDNPASQMDQGELANDDRAIHSKPCTTRNPTQSNCTLGGAHGAPGTLHKKGETSSIYLGIAGIVVVVMSLVFGVCLLVRCVQH